jgi:Ca2+-binding EF-hand superfamily protein
MDTDGNGTLDPDEVLAGYETHFGIPMTKEAVEEMFKAVDIDQSRSIDFNEFVMATLNETEMITNDKLKAAFKLFDKDNSGTISPEEIKEVLGIDEKNSH